MKNINYKAIQDAYKRIKKYIIHTPLVTNQEINKKFNAKIFFKLECNQQTKSFKIRGAFNKILQLNDKEKKRGVVAYSSGNHAQAVSYASKLIGIDATIVMPNDAPKVKITNTKKYGANIVLYDRLLENREKIAFDLSKKSGKILVKPFEDEDIINGQGTSGLEIVNELVSNKIIPDIYLCCCSGGGLIAGTGTYLRKFFSNLLIYSVEPEHYDDMRLSLKKDKLVSISSSPPPTICDALTVSIPGKITFAINKKILKKGLVVKEEKVRQSIRFLKDKLNIVVEPGGAVPTAALLSKPSDFNGKTVVIMVSGGNIDENLFNKIIKNNEE